MTPQRSNLVLAADVPHRKAYILVLYRLDVEAYCGYGGDNLAQLELVENGGLAGRVQAHHENAHLLLAEQATEYTRYSQTHFCYDVIISLSYFADAAAIIYIYIYIYYIYLRL